MNIGEIPSPQNFKGLFTYDIIHPRGVGGSGSPESSSPDDIWVNPAYKLLVGTSNILSGLLVGTNNILRYCIFHEISQTLSLWNPKKGFNEISLDPNPTNTDSNPNGLWPAWSLTLVWSWTQLWGSKSELWPKSKLWPNSGLWPGSWLWPVSQLRPVSQLWPGS